ncbi:endonuclease NucS domain-containing protein [Paraburkholderia sp. BCC1885]|uniref:DUF7669 domain-containing protein n=1 Tax=Paraburkholderia sp. BCC1885 TaxID=2562669 RepID=UPI0021B3FC53|nr:endonuclease NucS domain-containing protein [Paraburkholderia sp. BCC1885]
MSNGNRPPVWQMIREVVQQMSGECTYSAIKARVRLDYGDVNDSSMTCGIIASSVNLPSRIHYNENKKPRLCDGPHDFLFNTGRGRVVWYDPEKHGQWEIAQAADGTLTVRLADGISENSTPLTEAVEACDEAYGAFALEAHLRDYLAKNLPTLPGKQSPLMLYTADERDGVEFQTDVGPIDILATCNGDFYVLELKVGRGPDATLGQILRYMGWVKEHLADGKNVFGVIVASDISQKLKYAATQVPNVRLMEYDLAVTLRSVALHS